MENISKKRQSAQLLPRDPAERNRSCQQFVSDRKQREGREEKEIEWGNGKTLLALEFKK